MADKVDYIRLRAKERATWWLAGFKMKDGIYFAKGILYSKHGARYARIYEGRPAGIKPAMAKQFLDKQPSIGGYVSTGWMNYLNTHAVSPYPDHDPLGSLESTLRLFADQYGYYPEWVLVFAIAKERI